jgi:hypothetical protein
MTAAAREGRNTLPAKDPESVLPYAIDWTGALAGDTIASATWTVQSGITNSGESHTATTTTILVSGGTAGQFYSLTCHIVTAAGNQDDRTIWIPVADR